MTMTCPSKGWTSTNMWIKLPPEVLKLYVSCTCLTTSGLALQLGAAGGSWGLDPCLDPSIQTTDDKYTVKTSTHGPPGLQLMLPFPHWAPAEPFLKGWVDRSADRCTSTEQSGRARPLTPKHKELSQHFKVRCRGRCWGGKRKPHQNPTPCPCFRMNPNNHGPAVMHET